MQEGLICEQIIPQIKASQGFRLADLAAKLSKEIAQAEQGACEELLALAAGCGQENKSCCVGVSGQRLSIKALASIHKRLGLGWQGIEVDGGTEKQESGLHELVKQAFGLVAWLVKQAAVRSLAAMSAALTGCNMVIAQGYGLNAQFAYSLAKAVYQGITDTVTVGTCIAQDNVRHLGKVSADGIIGFFVSNACFRAVARKNSRRGGQGEELAADGRQQLFGTAQGKVGSAYRAVEENIS